MSEPLKLENLGTQSLATVQQMSAQLSADLLRACIADLERGEVVIARNIALFRLALQEKLNMEPLSPAQLEEFDRMFGRKDKLG
jgi:hypothetical protein